MGLDLGTLLHGKTRRMHHVLRYSSLPQVQQENVAEHSWDVAFLAVMIAADINMDQDNGWVLDIGKVALKALFHDISEIMSGDIIRSYKYGNEEIRVAMKNADEENVTALAGEIGGGAGTLMGRHWFSAKQGAEGEVVAFADMAAVVAYCTEEMRMGNTELTRVGSDCVKVMNAKFGKHPVLGKYLEQLSWRVGTPS